MMDYKAASKRVSVTLDYLGYSHDMVRIRQKSCADFTEIVETPYGQSTALYTGSKAEGLTAPYESDIDRMITPSHIMCATDPSRHRHVNRGTSAISIYYKLDREAASPGYTRLIYDGDRSKVHELEVTAVMVEVSGKLYLSSAKWKKLLAMQNEGQHEYGIDGSITHVFTGEKQGPSLTSRFLLTNMEIDNVTCYMCECPDILETWISRERKHDWPAACVVKEIVSMEAHVAPVGYKKSAFESLEWRICFTKAEIKLIQSLSGCQTKLLILLKMIAKHELKPLCREITSYVIKNLILWLAELFPSDIFIEENLISLLQGALLFLKIVLINNALPSYMIIQRNLFADRISFDERTKICAKIDELQEEGPHVVLRCEGVRHGLNILNSSPEDLYRYSRMRHELEMLLIHEIMHGDSNQIPIENVLRFIELTNGNPFMLFKILS